ncbi:MAG: hypothetical protein HQ513_03200 [Rhodospirillales bacterium]|nr:hypothetical protein [Rhodospirillales bacterium]
MRRWHFLFFLVSVLPIPVSTSFAAGRCAAAAEPTRVNVKTSPARIVYKTGHSRSDLERMQRAKGRHQGGGNWRVLGLTLTEFRYSIKTSAMLMPLSGGGYCAQPVSYDLTIGFSDFQVHIDRQYRRGSCEFAAIRDHELSHVALFRSNLSRYLPMIKAKARASAIAVKPVAVGDPDSGAKRLQDQMQRRINPLITKLNRDADTSNARIDTPNSYRNVHMLCDNW